MNATAPASVKQTRESNEGMTVGPGESDEELRKEAIASLKRKRRFVENVVGYVTVNGALWLIWALTDRSSDGGMPWPAWVSAIWGFFLAMDAWKAFGPWAGFVRRPISEADIEREMKRFGRS